MRTEYETEADLKREYDFRKRIEAKFKVGLYKLHQSMRMDFLMHRRMEPIAFVETKCRNNDLMQYPDLMLSANKWEAGVLWTKHASSVFDQGKLLFLIFISAFDGDWQYCYKPHHSKEIVLKHSGRTTQTRDVWDKELCVHIPTKFFKKF